MGENFHHSVKLTEGPEPALGHVGWRAAGPKSLEVAVARLEEHGAGGGWNDGDSGHGPAYGFTGPGGHAEEVFWEVERFKAEGDLGRCGRTARRLRPRGVAVRQIDHVTVATVDIHDDVDFRSNVLGFRFTGWTAAPWDHDPGSLRRSRPTSKRTTWASFRDERAARPAQPSRPLA